MNLRDQISRGEAVLWNGKKSVKVSVLEAIFNPMLRSVYKELHADHETGAADNK